MLGNVPPVTTRCRLGGRLMLLARKIQKATRQCCKAKKGNLIWFREVASRNYDGNYDDDCKETTAVRNVDCTKVRIRTMRSMMHVP